MPESSLGDINPKTPSCIFPELYKLLEKRKEEGQVDHLDDIHTELQRRLNVSGIEEKKSRTKN